VADAAWRPLGERSRTGNLFCETSNPLYSASIGPRPCLHCLQSHPPPPAKLVWQERTPTHRHKHCSGKVQRGNIDCRKDLTSRYFSAMSLSGYSSCKLRKYCSTSPIRVLRNSLSIIKNGVGQFRDDILSVEVSVSGMRHIGIDLTDPAALPKSRRNEKCKLRL